MTPQEMISALHFGRPGEEWSITSEGDITIDDVQWHSATVKPTQMECAQWLSECQAWEAGDGPKDAQADSALNTPENQALVDAFLETENRLRALEGDTNLATREQIINWLKAKYRSHL